jgi:hypothetical protein
LGDIIAIGLDPSVHTLYFYSVDTMHISFEKTAKHLLNIVVNFLSAPPTCGFEGCPLLGRCLLVLFYDFPCGTHHILVLQRNKCILDVKCRTLLLTYCNYYRFTISVRLPFSPFGYGTQSRDRTYSLVTIFKRCGATQRIRIF